jgi:hypothetical protein
MAEKVLFVRLHWKFSKPLPANPLEAETRNCTVPPHAVMIEGVPIIEMTGVGYTKSGDAYRFIP